MTKEKYNTPQWDIVWAELIHNEPSRLWILFYGSIIPKKNSRMWARGISLPSANYQEWHKRCKKCLKDVVFKFENFPCSLNIVSIIHNNVRKDLDNYTQSIQDFLTDIGAIPDDNNFIISEIHTRVVARVKNCPATYVELQPIKFWIAMEFDEDLKYDLARVKKKASILTNMA